MSKLSAISWKKPTKKYRQISQVPRVTVTAKPNKSKDSSTAPYFRIAMNKPFMEKYYPTDPKIRKISVYEGGQGVLFDPKPTKDQPFFEIRKGNYFNDTGLVEDILKHFDIPIVANEINTIHLFGKPFGKFDEKTIHELVYINGENPDTTQLAGLKEKMEADENFPEADEAEKPTKIKVEG
jgi:hypothetical protein